MPYSSKLPFNCNSFSSVLVKFFREHVHLQNLFCVLLQCLFGLLYYVHCGFQISLHNPRLITESCCFACGFKRFTKPSLARLNSTTKGLDHVVSAIANMKRSIVTVLLLMTLPILIISNTDRLFNRAAWGRGAVLVLHTFFF